MKVIYQGQDATLVRNRHNGMYDIEIDGTANIDPKMDWLPGEPRGIVIQCVYRDEFKVKS